MIRHLLRHPRRAVLLAGVLAYAAACLGTFVYDDLHSVRDNEALRDLDALSRFFGDADLFSALNCRMYRPVLLCTFALDHALGGGAAFVFKITSLLLHLGCALLLRSLALALGAGRVGATVGALLFVVHPLASEAVNMVSSRSEVLMLFGLLAALRSHVWCRDGIPAARIGTLLGTAIACGSKETGVMVVPLLVAIEVLIPARRPRAITDRWREIWPVLLAVGIYLLARKGVLGIATVHVPMLAAGHDPQVGHGRDLLTQLATMAVLVPRSLAQVLLPIGLSLDPEVAYVDTFLHPLPLLGVALLALVTGLGLRGPGPVRFFTLFAWATSLPWILIPLNVPLAEHRLYGLLAGVLLGLGSALPAARPPARRVVLRLAGVAGLAFAPLALLRSLDYRDERILWEQVRAVRPDSVRALCGLALQEMQADRLEAARVLLEEAIARYPAHVPARQNLAEVNLRLPLEQARPWTALVMAEDLRERSPHDPLKRLLLARCATRLGEATGAAHWFDAAERHALSCLEIAVPKGLVYRTAAAAREKQGDLAAAIALLDRAVRAGLDHWSVLLHRSELLRRAGRTAEADADLFAAQRQDPFCPEIQAAVLAAGPVGPR